MWYKPAPSPLCPFYCSALVFSVLSIYIYLSFHFLSTWLFMVYQWTFVCVVVIIQERLCYKLFQCQSRTCLFFFVCNPKVLISYMYDLFLFSCTKKSVINYTIHVVTQENTIGSPRQHNNQLDTTCSVRKIFHSFFWYRSLKNKLKKLGSLGSKWALKEFK